MQWLLSCHAGDGDAEVRCLHILASMVEGSFFPIKKKASKKAASAGKGGKGLVIVVSWSVVPSQLEAEWLSVLMWWLVLLLTPRVRWRGL